MSIESNYKYLYKIRKEAIDTGNNPKLQKVKNNFRRVAQGVSGTEYKRQDKRRAEALLIVEKHDNLYYLDESIKELEIDELKKVLKPLRKYDKNPSGSLLNEIIEKIDGCF